MKATLPFIWRLTIRVDDGGGAGGAGCDVTMLVNIVIMVIMMMMNLSWTGDTARGRYTGQWRTLLNSVIDMTQH
jgi:hypothetical protein